MTAQIYAGPTIFGFTQNSVYRDELPAPLQAVAAGSADILKLIAPLADGAALLKAVRQPGTEEYESFKRLAKVANKELDAPELPQPVPPPPGVGPVIDVNLQFETVAPADGSPYWARDKNANLSYVVRGTSTNKKVIFEMADPSGAYIPCTAFSLTDPTKMSSQTTKGNDDVPESWQIEVPAGWYFRARVDAIDNGFVTVIGKAVLS